MRKHLRIKHPERVQEVFKSIKDKRKEKRLESKASQGRAQERELKKPKNRAKKQDQCLLDPHDLLAQRSTAQTSRESEEAASQPKLSETESLKYNDNTPGWVNLAQNQPAKSVPQNPGAGVKSSKSSLLLDEPEVSFTDDSLSSQEAPTEKFELLGSICSKLLKSFLTKNHAETEKKFAKFCQSLDVKAASKSSGAPGSEDIKKDSLAKLRILKKIYSALTESNGVPIAPKPTKQAPNKFQE
jgi:hypothetical protein